MMSKGTRGTHHQVIVKITDEVTFTHDCAIVAPLEVEQVGEVDQCVSRSQLVIAVSATARHSQE
jgi:hypothetical protein